MSFISVAAGQPIRSTHVQQFTNWLTASKIDTPGTIACTSAAEYTLTVRSQETSSGLALAVLYGSSSSPSTIATFNKSLITLASPVRITGSLTYVSNAIHVGIDGGVTSDPQHGYYQRHTVSGTYSATSNLVDAMIVEVTANPSDAADLGAILGVMRCRDASAAVSARALAGQLFVHDGSQHADREAIELGTHVAKSSISKADNRTSYDTTFGNVGMLITHFTGDIESSLGGGTAVDANTAIVVATIDSGGTKVGYKQFEVFWDKNGVKAWQVDYQGNVVAGGGGNNAAAPAYGFLDTNGDKDAGTGVFWGGNDVVGFGSNSTEVGRFNATGLQVTGNILLSGNSRMLRGDTSNATVANRFFFQDATTDQPTLFATLPNGTSQTSGLIALSSSTATNSPYGGLLINSTAVTLSSAKFGSGTAVPLTFAIDGTEAGRFSTSGQLETSSGLKVGGPMILNSQITPTSISTATDNYAPTGIDTCSSIQISATGTSCDLTGLQLSSYTGQTGRMILLINVGGQNIVLKHETTSTAANRFNTHTSGDYTLAPAHAVWVIYTASGRWRTLAI